MSQVNAATPLFTSEFDVAFEFRLAQGVKVDGCELLKSHEIIFLGYFYGDCGAALLIGSRCAALIYNYYTTDCLQPASVK